MISNRKNDVKLWQKAQREAKHVQTAPCDSILNGFPKMKPFSTLNYTASISSALAVKTVQHTFSHDNFQLQIPDPVLYVFVKKTYDFPEAVITSLVCLKIQEIIESAVCFSHCEIKVTYELADGKVRSDVCFIRNQANLPFFVIKVKKPGIFNPQFYDLHLTNLDDHGTLKNPIHLNDRAPHNSHMTLKNPTHPNNHIHLKCSRKKIQTS